MHWCYIILNSQQYFNTLVISLSHYGNSDNVTTDDSEIVKTSVFTRGES